MREGDRLGPSACVLAKMQQLEARGQTPRTPERGPCSDAPGPAKPGLKQRQPRLQGRLELQRFGRETDGFSANCANHEAIPAAGQPWGMEPGVCSLVLLPHRWRLLRGQAGWEAPE